MTAQNKKQSIIFVGGGIGGLAAAQALTQQGIAVSLLEYDDHIDNIGPTTAWAKCLRSVRSTWSWGGSPHSLDDLRSFDNDGCS